MNDVNGIKRAEYFTLRPNIGLQLGAELRPDPVASSRLAVSSSVLNGIPQVHVLAGPARMTYLEIAPAKPAGLAGPRNSA